MFFSWTIYNLLNTKKTKKKTKKNINKNKKKKKKKKEKNYPVNLAGTVNKVTIIKYIISKRNSKFNKFNKTNNKYIHIYNVM